MNHHYSAGYDYFQNFPGKQDKAFCKACLAEMDVQRDVLITKCKFGVTLAEDKQYHTDIFTCSNVDHTWHRQIIALLRESERTPSQKLANLFLLEVEEIRASKKPTREIGYW